ncbi:MAG: hypothetical protein ACJ8C4_17215 [Gemmataceae bacterium]
MPAWLIEGDPTIILGLVVVALCAGAAWRKTRRRWLIGLATAALVFAGALVILDRLFESDREQIKRKLDEMAAAAKGPVLDLNKIFSHVSSNFAYGPHDSRAFRDFCERYSRSAEVKDVVLWDVHVADLSRADRSAHVSFQFKVHAPRDQRLDAPLLCRAEFRLDADNQWRLKTFKLYPLNMADQALSIPGLE